MPTSGPMRLLLGSGGFRPPERREILAAQMRELFGEAREILFVPYALADHDWYVNRLVEKDLSGGYALRGIHRCPDPTTAVRDAEGIYVGGGNTFRLLHALYELGLLEVVHRRVKEGMPYLGISAGSNVACPTIMTTNDMPIVQPPNFDALGLVPFQINAHYYHGTTYVKTASGLQEHFGETRDTRIVEFHEVSDTPVIGLWEGAMLSVRDSAVRLVGGPARVFRQGRPPVDVEPGQPVWPLPG